MLERESLPYLQKPYHLHEFLEKVSELLVESGAIAEPIRSIGGFGKAKKRRRAVQRSRDARRGIMFASREDYQMTEEEMAEFERQEEDDRKKREKELKEIKNAAQPESRPCLFFCNGLNADFPAFKVHPAPVESSHLESPCFALALPRSLPDSPFVVWLFLRRAARAGLPHHQGVGPSPLPPRRSFDAANRRALQV